MRSGSCAKAACNASLAVLTVATSHPAARRAFSSARLTTRLSSTRSIRDGLVSPIHTQYRQKKPPLKTTLTGDLKRSADSPVRQTRNLGPSTLNLRSASPQSNLLLKDLAIKTAPFCQFRMRPVFDNISI